MSYQKCPSKAFLVIDSAKVLKEILLLNKFQMISDSKTCKTYSPNDASLTTVMFFSTNV